MKALGGFLERHPLVAYGIYWAGNLIALLMLFLVKA